MKEVVITLVTLQGKYSTNIGDIAPCHLAETDPTIAPTMRQVTYDARCATCSYPEEDTVMVLGDYCNTKWHIPCLDPPLGSVVNLTSAQETGKQLAGAPESWEHLVP